MSSFEINLPNLYIPGSKSGEDLGSNLNSVMSSPSVDHFVSNLFHQQQNVQSQMHITGDAGSTTSGELRTGTGGGEGVGGGYTSDLLTQSAMVAADLASMLPSNSIGLGLGMIWFDDHYYECHRLGFSRWGNFEPAVTHKEFFSTFLNF